MTKLNYIDNFRLAGNGSGVNVYVIDTGIYPDHEYFNRRARVGYDAVDIDEQHVSTYLQYSVLSLEGLHLIAILWLRNIMIKLCLASSLISFIS